MIKYIHENVRSWLQDVFNGNQENSYFDFSLFHDQEGNSQYVKFIEVKNGLLKKKLPYIPVHIENMEVERVGIPNTKVKSILVQSVISIPIEQTRNGHKTFNETYQTIEDVIDEYHAKVFPFGEVKYDMSTANIEIDYFTSYGINKFGIEIDINSESEGTLYESSTTGGGFTISTSNGNFVFEFFKDFPNPSETLTVPITQSNNEILINKVDDTNLEVYVNLEKYDVVSSQGIFDLVSSKDELKPFYGYVKSIYAQQMDFTNLSEYLSGNITFDGLFLQPLVIITDFTDLKNDVDNDNTVTLLSGRIIESGEFGFISPSFNSPNPLTGLIQRQGINYQDFDFTFDITVTEDIYNASHVKYYLDNVEIFPINKNHSLSNTTTSEQMLESKVSKGVNSSTVIENEFTLFYNRNPKNIELIHNIKDDSERKNIYNLKITYPTFEEELEVIVSNIGISPVYVDPLNYSVSFEIADDILK